MKAYKGFDKNMQCRSFQFEEGKEYHEDKAELCESGFHACENPLDCFAYYIPSESVYHEVEVDDICEKKSEDDSKICGKHIKIGARLNILNIANLAVEYINSKIEDTKKESNTGNRSAATNTGYCSAATNTGDRSAATNTGNRSAASVDGKDSVAISTGYDSKAKASLGSAICVCERGEYNGKTYPLIAIKAAIIDGEILKPDTWYKLKDNEFLECENEQE